MSDRARARRPSPALNARQARFCEEYLVDLCAALAARRAGYSARRAKQTGHELMRMPAVRERISALMADRERESRIQRYRVLEELAAVTYSSVNDYVIDEDGAVALRPDAHPDAIRAVASIKRKRRLIPRKDDDPVVEVETELKLWSKPEAMRLAGQHLGMLVERHEHTGKDGGPIRHAAVQIYMPENGRDRTPAA